MDQVALKSKNYADPIHTAQGARDAVASLGGFSVNFSDILAKAGRRIETNVNGLSDHADLARAQDRPDEPRPDETYDTRRDDRPRDAERDVEHRPHADDRRDNRADDHRPAHRDDRADHAADRRDASSDHRRDDRPAATDTARPSSETAGTKHDSTVDTDDKTATADAGHGDKKHKKTEGSDGTEEATAKGGAKKSGDATGNEAGLAAALKHQTETTVAALLAQRNAAQTENGDTAGGKESRARGRGEAGDNTAGTLGQLVRQAAGEKAQGQTQTKGGDQAATQGTADNADGENLDGATETKAKNLLDAATNAKARQQAAEIADRIGDGNRVQVKVTSGNESQGLVSKPGAALTPTAVTADGQSQTPTAQAAVGVAQVQAQTQAQNQQGQAQAAGPQAIGDAKTQAATAAQTGPQAAAGQGGDAPSTQNANAAGQSNQASQTAQARNAEAAAQPRLHAFKQQVLDQVNVHVAKGLESGKDKITINLKPAELGRIEVQMEVARDGRMVATITADNRDTLDLLQRDSRDLAKALQDAGMQTDSGNLQFNLREQAGQGRNGRDRAPSGPARIDNIGETADAGPTASLYGGGIRADGRVDIRA